jgi:CHASE3 domain sensor protein
MAREVKMPYDFVTGEPINLEKLKAFEALVRADEREQGQKWFDAVTAQHKQLILAEREACAKAVEAEAHMFETLAAAKSLANAIRARGQP